MSTPEENTGNRSVVTFGSPVPEPSPTERHRAAKYRPRQPLVQRTLFDPSEIPVRDYPFFVSMLPPDKAKLDFEKTVTYNGSMVDSPESTPVPQAPSISTTEVGGEAPIVETFPEPGSGNLPLIDSAPHPLTLKEGRVVQRDRARRIIGATVGRRTTGALPRRRPR